MNKYKTPTNFTEYFDLYEEYLIVRRLFPIKDMTSTYEDYVKTYPSPDNKTISMRRYEACCIDSGYETKIIDKPGRFYNAEKCESFAKITATEDNLLFHGDKNNYIDGLDKVATKFTGLLKTAISKYNPERIVANRSMLKDIDVSIKIDECQFVEDGTYYLFPEITPDIAEFAIWKDIYEDPVPFRDHGGSNFYNIYEWVTIAIHKPEMFIKVR